MVWLAIVRHRHARHGRRSLVPHDLQLAQVARAVGGQWRAARNDPRRSRMLRSRRRKVPRLGGDHVPHPRADRRRPQRSIGTKACRRTSFDWAPGTNSKKPPVDPSTGKPVGRPPRAASSSATKASCTPICTTPNAPAAARQVSRSRRPAQAPPACGQPRTRMDRRLPGPRSDAVFQFRLRCARSSNCFCLATCARSLAGPSNTTPSQAKCLTTTKPTQHCGRQGARVGRCDFAVNRCFRFHTVAATMARGVAPIFFRSLAARISP